MARIIQIIATDENDRYFESALIDGAWHGIIFYPEPRTVCGVQLDGDDGIGATDAIEGKITCKICRGVVAEIQSIKKWK